MGEGVSGQAFFSLARHIGGVNIATGAIAPLVAAFLGLSALHGGAQAATCPTAPSTGDRVFTLSTSPGGTCLGYGSGNLNGNNDVVNQMGYVTLDKSDDASSGLLDGALTFTPPTSGLSGSFSISAPGYSDFVLALKSGEGRADPDWVAFLLPAGVMSGTWAISGAQALSHANLYAIASPVPAPAALTLLASGLALLGFLGWRRHSPREAF